MQITNFKLNNEGLSISANLCMSPCRSDYIITIFGVRRIVSEDSELDNLQFAIFVLQFAIESPAFPADCLHPTHFHYRQPISLKLMADG
jgi:hypothetical protein